MSNAAETHEFEVAFADVEPFPALAVAVTVLMCLGAGLATLWLVADIGLPARGQVGAFVLVEILVLCLRLQRQPRAEW